MVRGRGGSPERNKGKLEDVSIVEPLQNRQDAQTPYLSQIRQETATHGLRLQAKFHLNPFTV